jgi:hypothetical protein
MDLTQIITIVVIAVLALALGYLAGRLTAKPAGDGALYAVASSSWSVLSAAASIPK